MQWFRDELSVSHINCTALASQVLQSSTPGSNLLALPSSQTLQEFIGTEQTLPPSCPEDVEGLWRTFFLKKKHKTAFHGYVKVQNMTAKLHSILNDPGPGLGKCCVLPNPRCRPGTFRGLQAAAGLGDPSQGRPCHLLLLSGSGETAAFLTLLLNTQLSSKHDATEKNKANFALWLVFVL